MTGKGIAIGLFLAVLPAGGILAQSTYLWTTIAGTNGTFARGVDGTNQGARFSSPAAITVGPGGLIYVCDREGASTIRQIRRAGADWVTTTIAGRFGISGRADGTNQAATFNAPSGVAADTAGNLFVADWGNGLIRKITRDGTNWITTTIAGTNAATRIGEPQGPAVDIIGNVYVAGYGDDEVHELTLTNSTWAKTVLARGGYPFGSDPSCVALGPDGSLFYTDQNLYGHYAVRRMYYNGSNWIVGAIAGGARSGRSDGTNDVAQFNYPGGLAVDPATNIYVADYGNGLIRKVAAAGTNWVTTTIGGFPGRTGIKDGAGTNSLFYGPNGIAVDDGGNLYVADIAAGVIRRGAPLPEVSIDSTGGYPTVNWPRWATNFVLETSYSVAPNPVWSAVDPGELGGSQYPLTNSSSGGAAYFRLRFSTP
jgi:sugar lactone lactonase YvrE